MKVDRKKLVKAIESVIYNGVSDGEEIDITTNNIMIVVEPLILAVEAISQMQTEWEWVIIDFNDVDTFPLEFDRVLCLTVNDEYQVLHMLKYSDIHREWETSDLKRNESFCFEYVKQWKNINEPPTK